jgi:hypothetical protein
MSSDVDLAEALASRFHVFQDVYESYLDAASGTIPEAFFWEVAQDMVAAFLAGDGALLDWKAVLAFLESQAALGDPDVNEVIAGSLLWYLPWPGQPGHELTTMLGPVLAAKFKRIRPQG